MCLAIKMFDEIMAFNVRKIIFNCKGLVSFCGNSMKYLCFIFIHVQNISKWHVMCLLLKNVCIVEKMYLLYFLFL